MLPHMHKNYFLRERKKKQQEEILKKKKKGKERKGKEKNMCSIAQPNIF